MLQTAAATPVLQNETARQMIYVPEAAINDPVLVLASTHCEPLVRAVGAVFPAVALVALENSVAISA